MKKEIVSFNDRKFGEMRGYEENGVVKLSVEDTVWGLGFFNDNGEPRLNEVNRLLKKFGYPKKVKASDYIPENMFYRLAMKADTQGAENFQGWIADKVIPSIRKTGVYSVSNEITAVSNYQPSVQARQECIDQRNAYTYILSTYINYAQSQGDTREENKIYAKFTTLANKAAGIKKGKRPVSDDNKQKKCAMAEYILGEEIMKGMEQNLKYFRIEANVVEIATKLKHSFYPPTPLLVGACYE